MMTPKLIDARPAGPAEGFRVRLSFSDGLEGEIDLADELHGPVFEPLRDPQVFRRFRLNAELNTISWDTGADFAPEFLYQRLRQRVQAA